MTVFSNGSGISEIYVNGHKISSAYAYGAQVYSTQAGWQEAGTMTLTITAANNNSVSGTITYKVYENVRGTTVIDRYYERDTISLNRLDEGCVTLDFGENAVFYLGDENTSVEYFFPTSGTITMSATELARVYRFKKHNAVLDLGSAKTVTSNYIFHTQGMGITYSGNNLTLPTGWTIAQTNRACRIANKITSTYTLDVLNVPADGTWPVYAVATAAGTPTEKTVKTLTAAPNAYQTYDQVRLLGLITVYGGAITNFQNVRQINVPTSETIGKSTSGSTLNITAGYGTDADGMVVYVPSGTYGFSSMITAAADSTIQNKGEKVTVQSYSSSQKYGQAGVKTTLASGTSRMTIPSPGIPLPAEVHYLLNEKGAGQSHGNYTLTISNQSITDNTSLITWREYTWAQQSDSGKYLTAITRPIGGVSFTGVKTIETNRGCYYYPITFTTVAGTTQTKRLWANVSRDQDTGVSSFKGITEFDDESYVPSFNTPYQSYVFIGTLTVARNANTGSIA